METKKIQKLALLFDAISVREEDGKRLCTDYLKVEAKHLIDPTMLLKKENFVSLVEASEFSSSSGNMFTYVLDRNDKKYELINIVSGELDLIPFEVLPEQNFRMEFDKSFDINKCVFPKIEQWLRGFMDAEFVITDSFHGTAFSILFNKPFIAIVNKRRGASRFYSLLRTFGLENRAVAEGESIDLSLVTNKIDFDIINSILNIEREKSLKFLNESLND